MRKLLPNNNNNNNIVIYITLCKLQYANYSKLHNFRLENTENTSEIAQSKMASDL